MEKKKVWNAITSAAIPIFMVIIGAIMKLKLPEANYLGYLVILLAFIILYQSFYVQQIKDNQTEIKEVKKELEEIKEKLENREGLLNTIRDIVILKKVRKNEK